MWVQLLCILYRVDPHENIVNDHSLLHSVQKVIYIALIW